MKELEERNEIIYIKQKKCSQNPSCTSQLKLLTMKNLILILVQETFDTLFWCFFELLGLQLNA